MPLCSFYRTPRGCMYGDQCRFDHVATCRFFDGPSGCRFGNNCSFAHILSLNPQRNQDYDSRRYHENYSSNYGHYNRRNHDTNNQFPNPRRGNEPPFSNRANSELLQRNNFGANNVNYQGNGVSPLSDSQPPKPQFISRSAAMNNAGLQSAIEVSSIDEGRMQLCFTTECDILRMKYPDCVISIDERTILFTFVCTDPDWPFDMNETFLQMTFPSDYPKIVLEVECVHNEAVPRHVTNHINSQLGEYMTSRQSTIDESGFSVLMVRPFLKWLDRSIKDFYFRGLKQAKLNSTVEVVKTNTSSIKSNASANHIEDESGESHKLDHFVAYRKTDQGQSIEDAREQLAEQLKSQSLLEHNEEYEYSSSSDESGCEGDNVDQSEEANGDSSFGVAERCGIEIALLGFGFQTENACTISCRTIACSFSCSRCGALFELKLSPNNALSQDCSKCRCRMMVNFRPSLLHQNCNVLGYFDTENCSPYFNVNAADTTWAFMCSNCNQTTNSTAVNAEEVKLVFCHSCHQKYEVKYSGVKFKDLFVRNSALPKIKEVKPNGEKGKQKQRELLSLVPGEPLPKRGTCRHYRKSYRWLRFPCCGRVYPCDICHNDTEMHEIEFANRMICGFCSKEQGYQKSKACVGCSKELAGTTGSHWEGGRGCRNQKKMNKNDSQKYRNKNKTVAKKNVASNSSSSSRK